jgi:hypothetical protein
VLAGAQRVPFADVEAAVQHALEPFLLGLELLATAGFTRSLVHGLAPRCRDAERVARWCHGVRIEAAVRSKIAIAANRLLARRCAELGLGFVDVWADLAADDGFLDPRFDLDGIHQNRAATERTFPRVVAALARLDDGEVNPRQYELLGELAVPRALDGGGDDSAIGSGWTVVADAVQRDLRDPADLRDYFERARIRDAMQRGWPFEVGPCVAARAAQPVPKALAGAAFAAVRCAVFVSGTAPELRCELRRNDGGDVAVTLAPGSLLVVDPAIVRGVTLPDSAPDAVWHATVFARLPGESVHVITASSAWPADPVRLSGAERETGVLRRWREVEGKTVLVPRPDAVPAPAAV